MNYPPDMTAWPFLGYTHFIPYESSMFESLSSTYPEEVWPSCFPPYSAETLPPVGFIPPADSFNNAWTPDDIQRTQYMMATSNNLASPSGPTGEELAELQKLSNEYKPDVTGPHVGELQLSTAITTEYASADPILQAKTSALPQKYSHYRTVRGDGQCGWRAIAFGYFETLIKHGIADTFLEQETRLRSLSNVVTAAGFDPMLYEDFADATFDLLRCVAAALPQGDAPTVLLDTFNNDELQNCFIAYLKTLTTAWMKTHEEEYAPWLLGQTIQQYTDTQIMPISCEIDHVGVNALKDVLLSPAGIVLEVLYLDRSEGSEVNMHRFPPEDQNAVEIGTVRLLYRPGHYDLLYSPRDITPIPTVTSTYLQYDSYIERNPAVDIGLSDYLTFIPGMSFATPYISSFPGGYGGYSNHQAHSPVHPAMSSPSAPGFMEAKPQATLPSNLISTDLTHELPVREKSVQNNTSPLVTNDGGPFRSSIWELEPDFVQAMSQAPLKTRAFQNSHFNTAHFMNPSFHPEEWHPEDDITITGRSSRSGPAT